MVILLVLCNRARSTAMQDQVNTTTEPSECRGIKASLPRQSRRYDLSTSGRSGQSSRSRAALATLPCSTWQSIASFGVVMSSPFGSRMSLHADMQRIAQLSDKRRLDGLSNLN